MRKKSRVNICLQLQFQFFWSFYSLAQWVISPKTFCAVIFKWDIYIFRRVVTIDSEKNIELHFSWPTMNQFFVGIKKTAQLSGSEYSNSCATVNWDAHFWVCGNFLSKIQQNWRCFLEVSPKIQFWVILATLILSKWKLGLLDT